jgi:hypothetical protein
MPLIVHPRATAFACRPTETQVSNAASSASVGLGAAQHFGISRDSVRKMLAFSVPAGYLADGAREAAEAGRVHRRH